MNNENKDEIESKNESDIKREKRIIRIPAILVLSILIILIGSVVGKKIYDNQNKGNNNVNITESKNIESLTKIEKEIAGIETNDENKKKEKKNYSNLYKEYLKLPEEEKKKSEIIPRKKKVPFKKLDDIKEELDEDNNKVPKKFNLADKIDIKVEDQGFYGLCWDFASIKALETHLALNKLGDYDFSELHVDYITSDLMYGYRTLHNGGSFDIFQDYVIESGVVLENDVPYDHEDYSEEEYNEFNNMDKVVEVTEVVNFPSIYKNGTEKYTEKQLSEFRETVKKHIMKNGGLYTAIVGTGEKNHYTDSESSEWSNHAVTIVGWDDNYSKDNFKSSNGKKPKKDGAYIALNSWGTFYNDKGYYYISYEDKYVESDLNGIVSTSMDNAYKIDQIKNSELKKVLKEQYGHLFIKYKGKEYITKSVISSINDLDLSNRDISTIEGIEIFNNLYTLNLSNNNIEDLTPLKNLKNLTSLNLSNNKIKDISTLKSLGLYSIDLSNNDIKDVSILKNVKNEYDENIYLNISNNKNVKGYEKLNNIESLDISNCNIKDLSNLKNCKQLMFLNVSDSPGITGIEELSENLSGLNISNCDIKEFPKLRNSIYSIDVSRNPITDWSALKEIKSESLISNPEYEDEYEYEEEYDERNITITAKNCDIEDITIFNDIDVFLYLELQNNKIKDISQFRNHKIYYIDLSGNKDLVGLESLKNISTVILNDCNINDLSEVLKLENVFDLSLENNNLKDITEISNLKELDSLSLKGNKELTGIITSDSMYTLNISDCNLDNSFDLSNIKNLQYVNISNNNINDIVGLANSINFDYYIHIIIDKIEYKYYEELQQSNNDERIIDILSNEIIWNYNIENDNSIDLNQSKVLKKELMKNYVDGILYIKNGYLNKNIINIDDMSLGYVKIKLIDYSYFGESIIIIQFNTDTEEEESNNVTDDDETINELENEEEMVNETMIEHNENVDEDVNIDNNSNNESIENYINTDDNISTDNEIEENSENTYINDNTSSNLETDY